MPPRITWANRTAKEERIVKKKLEGIHASGRGAAGGRRAHMHRRRDEKQRAREEGARWGAVLVRWVEKGPGPRQARRPRALGKNQGKIGTARENELS